MSEQTANLCTTDAAESLRAVVAERDREIERLNSDYNEACEDAMCVARELERQKMNCLNLLQQLEDLKSPPSGVVMPPHCTDRAIPVKYRKGWNCCISEVARLNSSPVSAGEPVYQFQCREIGEGDWEPCDHRGYMYCQKSPEMDTRVVQVQALSAPSHGEQVRHMVPSWMASARAFVDRLHLAGWRDHADAQHAGVAGMYDELLAAAPSAGSQGGDV